MGKSIRFSELVKYYGQPYIATLWAAPDSDPGFSRAIRENRVLTVKQNNRGTKVDFGTIGFQQQNNASYFIFPHPLPSGHDVPVVGIKYEMASQPRVRGPLISPGTIRKRKTPRPSQPKKRAEQEREFTAVIKRTAVWETTIQVKATSKSQAVEKARAAATQGRFPAAEAIVRNEVRSVSEESRSANRFRLKNN